MTRKTTDTPMIVLASSSVFRRALLERLQLPFSCRSPAVNETAEAGESPRHLVQRLAGEKAQTVARRCEGPALVIGSDQVATLGNAILGKPGTAEAAIRQLQRMRGRRLEFLTGLCLINTATGTRQIDVVPFTVTFRNYSDTEIKRYVTREEPLQCAGSFRSESLGITLVESFSGSDPTALIGLPLIRLSEMLRHEGVELP